MKTTHYDYKLPDDLIALTPEQKRDECRLFVINRGGGNFEHKIFSHITEYINPGDVLVLNDTKVINARIYATRETGAKIEIVLLQTKDYKTWEALTNRSKRLKLGEKLHITHNIHAEIIQIKENGIKELKFKNALTPEILKVIGEIPLPPYIKSKRKLKEADNSWYQTVFSKNYGSKASPTAGLHFTDSLLDRLQQKGVIIKYITLHISLSTFNPIRTENIDQHEMHSEYFEVTPECVQAIKRAKTKGNLVFAVGTTAIRALESAAITGSLKPSSGLTDLYIKPGFNFNVCDAIITNFHTPKSTLLVLISAFAGYELIKLAYETALQKKYRFLSYGDSMLII